MRFSADDFDAVVGGSSTLFPTLPNADWRPSTGIPACRLRGEVHTAAFGRKKKRERKRRKERNRGSCAARTPGRRPRMREDGEQAERESEEKPGSRGSGSMRRSASALHGVDEPVDAPGTNNQKERSRRELQKNPWYTHTSAQESGNNPEVQTETMDSVDVLMTTTW